MNKQYPIAGSSNTRTLVDIWHNDINVLRVERQHIEYLQQYNYMVYVEKDVWEHLDRIKNSSSYGKSNFNPVGGHTSGNFTEISSLTDLNNSTGKLLKFNQQTPGLPTKMQIYYYNNLVNGHIDHRNLFIENPNLIANGSNEYEFGGRVFKKIPRKTEVNPTWSLDKIKEEHTYALYEKIKNTTEFEDPRFGQLNRYRYTTYDSFFSDGTLVTIKECNYEWQNLF